MSFNWNDINVVPTLLDKKVLVEIVGQRKVCEIRKLFKNLSKINEKCN